MRLRQNSAVLILIIALVAVGYGVYATRRPVMVPLPNDVRRARSVGVDQSSLTTAEQLVRLPTTSDERPFAEDALRIADKEMDLAFAQAVRTAASRPRVNTPETKTIDARLQQAQRALTADQAAVASLTAATAKANPTEAQSLNDRLNLAKAQAALDQDEVDDASQDLIRAGGDPQGQMQAMVDEHEAASKASDSIRVNVTSAIRPHGLLSTFGAWRTLNDKQLEIDHARASADSLAGVLKARHDRLEARVAARTRDSAAARLSHDSTTALLAATQRRALAEKTRTTLDQRVEDQRQLSGVYAGWSTVIVAQERVMINGVLRGIAVILLIGLLGVIAGRWMQHGIDRVTVDRRRAQTLGMVARVSLQVIAVLLVALVIFGPPDNLGTFLGLTGAGLTVALKDFIVAFVGWFILMGKNGIRIGDLVEINGVTGEVVELGMFYTELLETGSWSESGHPTGRRVAFTNGFAIEGHYFNFSTSGQWLWDEVRIVVPAGHDPYPLMEALRNLVEDATADSAHQAEAQLKGARRSPTLATITAAPDVSLKPIAGGVEIDIRYITRLPERAELRGKLYQTAVDMLGGVRTGPALRTQPERPVLSGEREQ